MMTFTQACTELENLDGPPELLWLELEYAEHSAGSCRQFRDNIFNNKKYQQNKSDMSKKKKKQLAVGII